MLLDISPYKFWKKKTDPTSMDDAALARGLADSKFILDNLGEYSNQIVHTAFFAFPAVGWGVVGIAGTMAASGAGLLAAAAVSYTIYKGGKYLLNKGIARAVNDKSDLTSEMQVREVKRRAKAKLMAIEQQEREIAAIRENARRAKEDFDNAVNAGLPLQQAIRVKGPLTFKAGPKGGFFKLEV